MAKDSPSQAADKFIFRMPDGMREQIAAAAKANNRSMNAEIVARLRASLEAPTSLSASGIPDHLEEIVRTYSCTHSLSLHDSLALLIQSGATEKNRTVVHVSLRPGMSLDDITGALRVLQPRVGGDAIVSLGLAASHNTEQVRRDVE